MYISLKRRYTFINEKNGQVSKYHNQTGNNLTNFLICFFAIYRVAHEVTSSEARFQSLVPSFMNVDYLKFVMPFSTKALSFLVLMFLSGLSCTGFEIFNVHSL